MAMVEC